MKSLGQIAYEAYCETTNWKSLISGQRLPQWLDVRPEIKAAWEASAGAIRAAMGMEAFRKTQIICLCGSSSFCDVAAVKAWEFEKQGIMAIGMHLLPEWYHEETQKKAGHHYAEQEGVAHILDELHLRKIEMADEVFVVNPVIPGHEHGYIGDRTRIEIAHALQFGKPVKYLNEPEVT